MKKILIVFVTILALAVLVFVGYKKLYLKPSESLPIVLIQPTPSATPVDLKSELNATVDDGGQADLKALDEDAAGL